MNAIIKAEEQINRTLVSERNKAQSEINEIIRKAYVGEKIRYVNQTVSGGLLATLRSMIVEDIEEAGYTVDDTTITPDGEIIVNFHNPHA